MDSTKAPDVTCDVLVVGAGPAGAAAAITLQRAGHDVLLIDKAKFPRDKCCGDGLTTLALRELEALGLDIQTVEGWFDVDAAWLRSPSGREICLPLPDTGRYAAVAPRLHLDNALVELARSSGVDVRDGHGFKAIEPAWNDARRGHVLVEVEELGWVAAKFVIAADGMWSPVRKAVSSYALMPLNDKSYRGEWHAFRQYASNVTGPASDRLIVWFEEDLLPGYAWSFPLLGNRANVGFGVLRDGERKVREMGDLWRDLLGRPHIVEALGEGFEMEGRHLAWPIPARINEVQHCAHRVLFVGDAAAAADVLTGEGIGQALLTGRLAAESIDDALKDSGAPRLQAGVRYIDAVEHHLFADHRLSKRLNRVLAHPRGARAALRIVAASGTWGRRNFARWMFEDEPRAIVTTPRRWHRRFLKRPGAYV
jgi:geranylgeranyl reductase family protein